MGYFKAPRKAKSKGAGLYFHCHPFRVCEVLDSGVIAAKRGPCLTDCISGFPAFAENDGKTGALALHLGHSRPLTFVTLAVKAGGHVLEFSAKNPLGDAF